LVLVGVEFADGAFFDVEAQEAAEVAGAEPGLVSRRRAWRWSLWRVKM
jgi:hypothetical protein